MLHQIIGKVEKTAKDVTVSTIRKGCSAVSQRKNDLKYPLKGYSFRLPTVWRNCKSDGNQVRYDFLSIRTWPTTVFWFKKKKKRFWGCMKNVKCLPCYDIRYY